jgi:pimeloyl-ACP methyl ester carboxylesterase
MRSVRLIALVLLVLAWGAFGRGAAGGAGPRGPAAGGHYLKVDGGRIYYEEGGRGPCVVLLHDGLVHAVGWDGQWEPLCKNFHAARYDRRGYGRSDMPTAPFSPTADLAALLTHLKAPRATLVGCSSGAGLALDYAIENPGQVEQLILIGPVLHGMATSAHFYLRGEKNNAPLARADVKAAAENWSQDRYQVGPGHDAARKALYEALVHSPHNLSYPGNLERRPEPPAVDRLSAVRVPTLILVGEFDIPDVQAYAGAIEAGVWGARREVVSGCGHLIALEQPERVTRVITTFAQKYRAAAVTEKSLRDLAGKYRCDGSTRDLVLRDGRLTLRLPGERDMPLFAESDAKFFGLGGALPRLEFVRDGSGRVTHLDWHEGGSVRHWERVAGAG